MVGIRAWNRPNHRPQIKAMRHENRLVVSPLQIETEKASIDRPTAIRRSSRNVIVQVLGDKNNYFWVQKINTVLLQQFNLIEYEEILTPRARSVIDGGRLCARRTKARKKEESQKRKSIQRKR